MPSMYQRGLIHTLGLVSSRLCNISNGVQVIYEKEEMVVL